MVTRNNSHFKYAMEYDTNAVALFTYEAAANMRLNFSHTQDSISNPGHRQSTRLDECALA